MSLSDKENKNQFLRGRAEFLRTHPGQFVRLNFQKFRRNDISEPAWGLAGNGDPLPCKGAIMTPDFYDAAKHKSQQTTCISGLK